MGRESPARSIVMRAALFLLAAIAWDASAQTWTGVGADNNWSTGANWSGGVAPASSGTTIVHFPIGSPRLAPVVDAPWTINQMDFADIYHVSGQAITLAGTTPSITCAAASGNAVVIDNPIVLTGATFIGTASAPLHVTGSISGTGPLTLGGGPFPVALYGVSTFTGGTTVVTFAFLQGTLPGPTTVDGILTTGIGATNAGPLTVNPAGTLDAQLLNTGDLAIAGGLGIGIDGTTPGTQYGTVNVTGTVNLTGARLSLTGSYVPVAGDGFTIVTNDGADPVVGNFASLESIQGGPPVVTPGPFPEGATITFNGVPLRISYVGGTGNDVTLTALAGAAPATPAPTLSQWVLVLLATIVLAIGMRSRFGRR